MVSHFLIQDSLVQRPSECGGRASRGCPGALSCTSWRRSRRRRWRQPSAGRPRRAWPPAHDTEPQSGPSAHSRSGSTITITDRNNNGNSWFSFPDETSQILFQELLMFPFPSTYSFLLCTLETTEMLPTWGVYKLWRLWDDPGRHTDLRITSSPLTSRLASSMVLLVRLTSSWQRSFSEVAVSKADVSVSRLASSSWHSVGRGRLCWTGTVELLYCNQFYCYLLNSKSN